MTGPFVIEALSSQHDRNSFACGVDALDGYLRRQASQDVRRRVSNCFVAVGPDTNTIAGYYTLAASSIPLGDLPNEEAKRLPRYPIVPAALLGRLAIDERYRGQGLGAALLFDALERANLAAPAVYALLVDAKDDRAQAFYKHFGFIPFSHRPRSSFLPLATVTRLRR